MTCLRDESGLDGDDLLALFADGVRRDYALGPPPRVEPALAEVLAAGTRRAAAGPPARVAVPERRAGGLLARLHGHQPRLALGAAAASLAFLGVGAAGALPGPAQSAFDRSADTVGLTLPERTRDSTAPDAHGPSELPGSSASNPRDEQGAGEREGTNPTVPAPWVGDRQPAEAEGRGAADAADSAGPALRDVDVPDRDSAERPRHPHPERSTAEERPAPVPGRGTQPNENGGPGSGVAPGRGSEWHRPSWGPPRAEPTEPAVGHRLGHEAGRPAQAPPERAYPSVPPRR